MEIQQREQEWYEKVRQFVVSSFTEAGKISKSNHLIRTAALVKILEPHADTMLLTAALSHDIEKAYRSHESLEQKEKFGLVDPRFLRIHEERGAEIMKKILENIGAQNDFIQEVTRLIAIHEEGGDERSNILQAADSVSFFEEEELGTIEKMLKKETTALGLSHVKEKIHRMYERIQIPLAKEMAEPGYNKVLEIMKIF